MDRGPVGGDRVSLWHATAPPRDGYEALHEDISVDVVVVGAGLTGLTCAVLLAQDGSDVAVLEARRIGAGTTGGTTGKVTSQHGLIYQRLVDQHGQDVAHGYARANEDAIGTVRDLVARHSIDADLDVADAYVYTEDRGQLERMQREVDVAQDLGLPATWEETTDLPFDVHGAVRFADQAQIHAVKYLHGLAEALTSLGGRLYERSRAVGVAERDGRRVIETTRAAVEADHVVLATLTPIIDRGFEFARTEPSMTYGLACATDRAVPEGMYISAEDPSRSVRHYHAQDETFVVVVGEGHRTGEQRDTGRHDDLLEAFARDRLGTGDVRYRWAAQDFVPVDLLPMVGEVALAPQVYVATGMNKWGLTNGTVAAEIISDVIAGRDNPYAGMLRTTRANLTASAKRFFEHNLDAAKRFVGDRLDPDGWSVDEIPPGGAGVILVDGEYRAVCRTPDGSVQQRSAVCPHLGCIVQWNEAEATWDCPCHGSRYDRDGDVLCGPATSALSDL